MNRTIASMVLFTLTLVGCSGKVSIKEWTATHKDDRVVWADDGSEVAVIVLSYEEKGGGLNAVEKRNFHHQIFTQQVDGSGRKSITEVRDTQNGEHFFYMKQAGYFIVESLLEKGKRRFDKVKTDGREILIIETPDNEHQPCRVEQELSTPGKHAKIDYNVIPSPDGGQLAYVRSEECGQVTIDFMYANNLSYIASYQLKIDEPLVATWHPLGYLLLTNQNRTKAWRVSVEDSPTPVNPPNCLYPPTTSSDISIDGRKIYLDNDKLVTQTVGPQQAFGCQ